MKSNRKLVIFDADLGRETHSVMAKDNWVGQLNAVNKLREIAKDKSICGWINEYDLSWSSAQCANKHDL
jgi:molybdopterin/thiamine biosynthesis adenylyltransferase